MDRKPSYKLITRAGALLLAVLVLSGCKPSPAFTETLYNDQAQELHEDADTSALDNSEEHTDPEEALPPKKLDEDAGDPRDRERENSVNGEGDADDPAPAPEYRENANQNGGGADRTEDQLFSDPEGDAAGTNGAANVIAGSETGAVRQIVDARGAVVDLPEQVAAVSAVGEAAVLVKMLGGTGRIAAGSASLGEGAAASFFAGEEYAALWSGCGQSPLSGQAFAQLLAAAPQVCFEISGQSTFSDEQIAALTEAGIAYVALPAFTSGSNIRLAVSVIGAVLGDYNGVDAFARAQEYLSFYDRVMNLVDSRVEMYSPDGINYDTGKQETALANHDGVFALFIDAWDPGVSYDLHDDAYVTISGLGLPVVHTGFAASPVTYFLSAAGVANTAALKENNYSIYESRLKYVNPIDSPNKTLTVTGQPLAVNETRYIFTSAGGNYLGDEGFRFVIAADPEIKAGLEASALWANYGTVSSATGLTHGYGFLDQNGDIVTSTVHGDYEICVLPSGIGSWSEGSAESVLTALWAAWRLRGEVSEAEVRGYVSEFYETFYGSALSDGQLDAILRTGQ